MFINFSCYQEMHVGWGSASTTFHVSNGVKQGGIS